MAYEKVGTIDDISEIQFDKHIIVNGHVNKTGWMWHMEGRFEKRENETVFIDNVIGLARKVKDGEIGLVVLEKV